MDKLGFPTRIILSGKNGLDWLGIPAYVHEGTENIPIEFHLCKQWLKTNKFILWMAYIYIYVKVFY